MKLRLLLVGFCAATLLSGCRANNTEQLGQQYQSFQAAHPGEKIGYSLLADLDGDDLPERAVVLAGKDGLGLWFITPSGAVAAPGNDQLAHMTLRGAILVQRSEEQHLTLFAGFPPQNTAVRVYRLKEGQPEILLDFMADWDARVTAAGIEAVSKRYKPEGGYTLVGETYRWEAESGTYRKQGAP